MLEIFSPNLMFRQKILRKIKLLMAVIQKVLQLSKKCVLNAFWSSKQDVHWLAKKLDTCISPYEMDYFHKFRNKIVVWLPGHPLPGAV